jgi:DNA primase
MSDLIDLLQEIGLEDIRPNGEEIHARCPAHERILGYRERIPRHWSLNIGTGQHHCFSCEYGGSLVKLTMDQTGLGLWEATRLIHSYDVEFDRHDHDDDYQHDELSERDPIEELASLFTAIQQREGFWRRHFSPVPTTKLRYRGITVQAAEDYELRWDCQTAEWIFAIAGRSGLLAGWQRKYGDQVRNQPTGVRKSEYLFGLDRLDATRAIVVESPLDVVYLHTLGHRYSAVSSFGANVSDAQMELLAASNVLSVVLALDNDDAGQKGTQSLLERGWHRRLPLFLFDYGDATGKDPGELSVDEIERGLAQAKRVPARRRTSAR